MEPTARIELAAFAFGERRTSAVLRGQVWSCVSTTPLLDGARYVAKMLREADWEPPPFRLTAGLPIPHERMMVGDERFERSRLFDGTV